MCELWYKDTLFCSYLLVLPMNFYPETYSSMGSFNNYEYNMRWANGPKNAHLFIHGRK